MVGNANVPYTDGTNQNPAINMLTADKWIGMLQDAKAKKADLIDDAALDTLASARTRKQADKTAIAKADWLKQINIFGFDALKSSFDDLFGAQDATLGQLTERLMSKVREANDANPKLKSGGSKCSCSDAAALIDYGAFSKLA